MSEQTRRDGRRLTMAEAIELARSVEQRRDPLVASGFVPTGGGLRLNDPAMTLINPDDLGIPRASDGHAFAGEIRPSMRCEVCGGDHGRQFFPPAVAPAERG